MIILANPRSDWNVLRPLLFESIGQTLTMVLVTLVIGGFLGLILGVVLYGTRPGNLFENAVVYRILDIIVNIVRPIPFIIFLAAMQPLTIVVVGTSIGTVAAIFPMVVMCTFATSRLVEQNLVPVAREPSGLHESNQIVRTANNSLNILGVHFIGAAGSCRRRQTEL